MERTEILNALWTLQNDKEYNSDSDVTWLAKAVNSSVVEIEGVISFYHFFHGELTGSHTNDPFFSWQHMH